jgi:surface protein
MKRLCKYLIALTASILLLLPASQIESIQAEEMQAAETFHATDLTGTAYATLDTSTGEFVFHRTAPGEKVPKKSGTVLVYSGFETRNYSRFGVPWRANHLDIKTIRMEADIQPTSMAFWFAECSGLVSADFSRLDTSKTTSLSSTFMGCTSLKTINVSSWDTSSLSGLSDTFYNCKSLKELNVSGWDTTNFMTLRNAFC